MNFTDKIALVTGGGNGIGRASALLFAEHGAAVVVVDKDAVAAADTARLITEQGGDALDVAADVSRSDQVQAYVAAALRKHDRIDCFFNNAGIEGQVAPTAEYDEDVFDSVMAVNVKGVFLGLRHVSSQQRIDRRAGRFSRHAGLCCFQTCCYRPDQGHGRGGVGCRRAGQRSLSRSDRNAHDPGPCRADQP